MAEQGSRRGAEGDFLRPQTPAQVLRCFSLGGYAASVVEGELKIRGPQPLAGPLPASVKANREEIIHTLVEVCGGVWPPAPGSEFFNVKRSPPSEVSEKRKRFQETLRIAAMTRRARRFERRDILPTASPCTRKLVRGVLT